MSIVHKVIVTNIGVLRRKIGRKGAKKIVAAVEKLIKADEGRGIQARWIALDRKSDMKTIGNVVTGAGDRRQVKRAVDDIHDHFQPHYLMLLGAPDVIPHQSLVNPLFDPDVDPDRRVESDLPYACSAGYSTNINDFLGPGRVVGRLPDINGGDDSEHLVRLLENASTWKTGQRSSYARCFGITAEAWKDSTRTSVRKIFGTRRGVKVSPDAGPDWTRKELGDRIHFINCHGDTAKAEFYGESEHDDHILPVSHRSIHLVGRVRNGTVVAAECCFGAELYEPIGDGLTGICQTYLGEGAWGFFGSTTIAYGPARGNRLADLICIEFVRAVRDGASLGRAALTAQQKFIGNGGHMGPHDLKTIAQFLLLGDPSIHPVKPASGRRTKSMTRKKGRTGVTSKLKTLDPRAQRRKRLASRGNTIGSSTATVAQKADAKLSAKLRAEILKRCRDFAPLAMLSFRLRSAAKASRSVIGKKLAGSKTIFHILSASRAPEVPASKHPRAKGGVAVEARPKPAVKTARIVIAREVDGKLDEVMEIYRH